MAPVRRTKARASAASTASAASAAGTPGSPAAVENLPPPKEMTPPRSPLRRVAAGGISKAQKAAMIDNLKLEVTERARKLRAQYAMQARTLRQRIEMRINRVPKKFWKMKMGDLLIEDGGKPLGDLMSAAGGAKKFVDEIRRLSAGTEEKTKEEQKEEQLVIPKKRAPTKKPPPKEPAPQQRNVVALGPSTSKTNLAPSSSFSLPYTSSSPHKSSPQRPSSQKPSAKVKKPTRPISAASNTRSDSRTTTRSSLETAGTNTSTRGTKSSQAKAAAAAQKRGAATGPAPKRGQVKGASSNSSLKENRVAGAKAEPAEKKAKRSTAGTGRVLRSRK